MSNLKQLEQELVIAKKFNLGAREINKLESLIENEKAKMQNKKGEHRKLLAWIISIILMASYSYLQAEIVKVKVVKPKKSKTEQRKDPDKKEVETDKEHECEKERLLCQR